MTMSHTAMYSRRHDLDALRAFAMLLGIALHALLSFTPVLWPVQDSRKSEFFGLIFAAIHGFRTPVFFVMSGFFTAMLWRRRGLRSALGHPRASRRPAHRPHVSASDRRNAPCPSQRDLSFARLHAHERRPL